MAKPIAAIAFNNRVGNNSATAPPANAPNKLVNTRAAAAPKNTTRGDLQLPESAREVFERYADELESIFVVSSVEIAEHLEGESDWVFTADFDTPGGRGTAYVLPPKEAKCPRCWRYVAPAKDELCRRCEDVVSVL